MHATGEWRGTGRMTLKNKLGLDNGAELARMEEQISKQKAVGLLDSGEIDAFPTGTTASL